MFEYMRKPGGKPMPDDLYEALKAREVAGPGDPRLQEERFQDAYGMAVAWEAVARLMQYRAHRDARRAGQCLEYAQAIGVARSGILPERELRRALQVVNMSNTGKLMGMCPLFRGMRVRLGAKLSARHKLVHDAVGTVEGVAYARGDEASAGNRESSGSGVRCLRQLPRGVCVRMDGVEEDFGAGRGVVLVRPVRNKWTYNAHLCVQGERV